MTQACPVASDSIVDSLELVVEKCGDPTELVYKRLFAQHPDMKPLFMLDKDNSVKGNMLAQVLECFMDFTGKQHYASNLIACELVNHEMIGVPPDVFSTFFITVVDTFKDILQDDWTPAYDAAWSNLVNDLTISVAEKR